MIRSYVAKNATLAVTHREESSTSEHDTDSSLRFGMTIPQNRNDISSKNEALDVEEMFSPRCDL